MDGAVRMSFSVWSLLGGRQGLLVGFNSINPIQGLKVYSRRYDRGSVEVRGYNKAVIWCHSYNSEGWEYDDCESGSS